MLLTACIALAGMLGIKDAAKVGTGASSLSYRSSAPCFQPKKRFTNQLIWCQNGHSPAHVHATVTAVRTPRATARSRQVS